MDRKLIGFAAEVPRRKFVQPSTSRAVNSNVVKKSPPKTLISDYVSPQYSLNPSQKAKNFKPVQKNFPKALPITEKESIAPKEPEPLQVRPAKVAPNARKSYKKTSYSIELSQPNAFSALVEKYTNKFRLFSVRHAFIAAGILIFVSGLIISINGFRANNEVIAQVGNNTSHSNDEGSTSSVDVSEDVPPKNRPHNVAPDEPKRISIPKVKVNSLIMQMGVDSNNQLKAPTNIHDTGWYKNSSKPGQSGAMLLDGHVSGPTKPGVFKNIGKLVKDDMIEVERGDGQKFNYKVVKTKSYPAEATDMLAAMSPVTPGESGLNLITCSGPFDKKSNQYKERTIVFAVLAE